MNIGIDIVEVRRIEKLIKDKSFLARVFTGKEIAYCHPKKNRAQHYAVRFAAKEAVFKSLGAGEVPLKSIGIKNLPSGKPEVYIKGKKSLNIDISLSHTAAYAVAVAIRK
ncbi:MAG: holo-ACP synthase [Elusimicrobia bacterium]|nr:holo-ACP synthase [Elusimicrobiota bacterium]